MGLFTPAWNNWREEKALRAVQGMTNQRKLAIVARKAGLVKVRLLAVSKLTEQVSLMRIARNDWRCGKLTGCTVTSSAAASKLERAADLCELLKTSGVGNRWLMDALTLRMAELGFIEELNKAWQYWWGYTRSDRERADKVRESLERVAEKGKISDDALKLLIMGSAKESIRIISARRLVERTKITREEVEGIARSEPGYKVMSILRGSL